MADHDDIRDLRVEVDDLRDTVIATDRAQTVHEAVCAERYERICDGQKRVLEQMKWMFLAFGLLLLVDLCKASLPDMLHTLLVHG